MRNLVLEATSSVQRSGAQISCIAFDIDNGEVYIASDNVNADADVEVEIYKAEAPRGDPIALWTTPSSLTAIPGASGQVLSLKVLPESRSLVIVTRGGEIATLNLDEEDAQVQVVGSFDDGIQAVAWSPDESSFVLVSGDKLILMTPDFDVLSENLLETSDFGADAPINVGWGSKQTQFHGSLGKAAAQTSTPLDAVGTSPDDDGVPRISWRGDGALFAVSALSPHSANPWSTADAQRRRVLRVYDRAGALQATSEPVPGLEHALAWRPSGSVLAGTQRFGFAGGGRGKEGRHDVVFFERNGLRHGEFALREPAAKGGAMRWGYRVRELAWSADSSVLAVWLEREGAADVVQLWTTGNYHWYLKQEIVAPDPQDKFTTMTWHPERALQLALTTKTAFIRRTYAWETAASPCRPPHDTGAVAVADGTHALLTPFRTQNVPPPMCSARLALDAPRVPVHLALGGVDTAAALWEDGRVRVWALRTRVAPGRGKAVDPQGVFADELGGGGWRQIALPDAGRVVALGVDVVRAVHIEGGESAEVLVPARNGWLVAGEEGVVWQSPDGELRRVDFKEGTTAVVARFPEFCFAAHAWSVSSSRDLFVGLSGTGKLHVAVASTGADPDEDAPRTLATNVNSFVIAGAFLVWTDTAHEAHFAPHADLLSGGGPEKWERRRVERGSRIVTAVPSAMALVLQMPRGNLETISPRPLVMEVVRQDVDRGDYLKAFLACRKHRIDLNVLVEHDRVAFTERLSSFVEQIDDVDYMNLFLTGIGRGLEPASLATDVCDAVRLELEKRDLRRYVNSILTAYVVKTPPDHEAGLRMLLRLRESDPEIVEDAVKYIIFLVDADSLFDTALGMYDFSLVLMIAQHAQKDPREYLPFLRELRALEKYYQRFRIDDHLRRHGSALRNLSLAGDDRFEEAIAYIEQHLLHEEALRIWKGTERFNAVLSLYGDHLFDRREFRQAALAFVEAEDPRKAMVAYEKALDWRELFDIAMRQDVSAEDLKDMAYRVSDDLQTKKQYTDAARVLLDYTDDVRQAVIALVEGNAFSEARRMITLKKAPELLEEIVHPGALESRAQLADDMDEMRTQLRKQLARIRELRVKKETEPEAFWGTEDAGGGHNVDVMTDAGSMAPTAFTRYTQATRSSKMTSRSKRKAERKVGSGRKGTVDEAEYLLTSIAKLVGRFQTTRSEARALLPHLFQLSAEHREEGGALQAEMAGLELEVEAAVEEIWAKPSAPEGEGEDEDSWAARMAKVERERKIDPVERVAKPAMARSKGDEWRVKLLE